MTARWAVCGGRNDESVIEPLVKAELMERHNLRDEGILLESLEWKCADAAAGRAGLNRAGRLKRTGERRWMVPVVEP